MGKFYYDRKGYPRWADSGALVHRTVAENKVGGRVGEDRVVHHRDGNPHNFRRDNLVVMDRSDHSRLHAKKRSSWW